LFKYGDVIRVEKRKKRKKKNQRDDPVRVKKEGKGGDTFTNHIKLANEVQKRENNNTTIFFFCILLVLRSTPTQQFPKRATRTT
jgi:hypothetical protein